MSLIDSIKKHEGFIDHVYKDKLGLDTIGYGTLMPITEEEATLLLQHRLDNMILELSSKQPVYSRLPKEKADIIAEMAYQMGIAGVLNFHNMWKALDNSDYEKASKEMLDSKWANQTPKRAKELSERMKE